MFALRALEDAMSRDEILHYLKSGWDGYRIGALGTGLPFALFLVLPWLYQYCLHTFYVIIPPELLVAVWMLSCPFEAMLGNLMIGKRLTDTLDIKNGHHAMWSYMFITPMMCAPFAGVEATFHGCRGLSAVFLIFGAMFFLVGSIGKWMEKKGVKL